MLQDDTPPEAPFELKPETEKSGAGIIDVEQDELVCVSAPASPDQNVDQEMANSERTEGFLARIPKRNLVPCPRLVKRDLPFYQSWNRLHVEHNQGWKIFALLQYDWFHVILRVRTMYSLSALLIFWTLMIMLFALFYIWVDNEDPEVSCGLGDVGSPIKFGPAFAFSLETCTTVGYGLPNGTNAFFDNCRSLQAVIYFQMIWSMMFNAFLFAFFYSRLAKCDSRGTQVVFSNQAIVSIVDGQVRFQVRIYDVDAKDPVIEAHIRMYAVRKDRPVPRALRILQPDDDLGAMLFLSVPAVAAHHIGVYSMLHPPRMTPVPSAGVNLRQVDSTNCSREEIICPVCGESYGTYNRLRQHILYQTIMEQKDKYPIEGTHLSLNLDDYPEIEPKNRSCTVDTQELKEYFEREISEIICVVEGIEPIGSGTFAALQSYRFEDILFEPCAQFHPCIEAVWDEKKGESHIRVDLDRFHVIDIGDDVVTTPDGIERAASRSSRPQDSFLRQRSLPKRKNERRRYT